MLFTVARFSLVLALFSIASGARFDYPNFYNTINLNLQGTIKDNGELLVSGAGGEETGSVWLRTPIDLTKPFTTSFQFSIDGGGADGLAFVIQGMSDAAVGEDASGIGYAGITNSIAMEFDTYKNDVLGDPNDNHISIHMKPNGQANSAAEYFSIYTNTNPGDQNQAPVRLDSGLLFTVQIQYQVTPAPFLIFNFNNNQIFTRPGDLASALAITNGKAWIGFTSATGGKSQDHHVHNWFFYQSNMTEPCFPNFVTSQCAPNPAGADVSCSSISDCESCTKSPFPCSWSDGCTFMSGRGGGATSILDCPTSTDKSWIWIVVSCICIVLATLGLLYYFRRRQLKAAGGVQQSTGYNQVEEAPTTNYAPM